MMERILGPLPKHMIQKTRYVGFVCVCVGGDFVLFWFLGKMLRLLLLALHPCITLTGLMTIEGTRNRRRLDSITEQTLSLWLYWY